MLTSITPGVQIELKSLKLRGLLRRLLIVVPFADEDRADSRNEIIASVFRIFEDLPEDVLYNRLFAIYYDDNGTPHFYTLSQGISTDPSRYDYVVDAVQSFGIKTPECNWFKIPYDWFTIPYDWSLWDTKPMI
jgi:hypothetical protein